MMEIVPVCWYSTKKTSKYTWTFKLLKNNKLIADVGSDPTYDAKVSSETVDMLAVYNCFLWIQRFRPNDIEDIQVDFRQRYNYNLFKGISKYGMLISANDKRLIDWSGREWKNVNSKVKTSVLMETFNLLIHMMSNGHHFHFLDPSGKK